MGLKIFIIGIPSVYFDIYLWNVKGHLIFQGRPLIDNKQSLIEELQKKVKKLESQLERKVDEVDIKPLKEKVCNKDIE